MRRRSIGSILVANLDPKLKERILNFAIPKENLKKFEEEEKREIVKDLSDLRDLTSKSETEVYATLNLMCKNKQFFMYCGPLLLNINPGPNFVNDYLNLQSWVTENKNINEEQWKPHLYSFVYYVYQTLISENTDQVVNMLGQIGSGKTFNLVHIIEYLCCMAGPEGMQNEVFDVIHKSLQLIHIMGSIFRQNNIESTSCGMLLRLGFNNENKICNFDLDAKILEYTLPFSENGRSFSVLHALMTGASSELKKFLELPETDEKLNFFRKFTTNFSDKTKERFKLNDLEIWTRFHSLLNAFKFSKQEIIEILQILSFILLCNEAAIGKIKSGKKKNIEEFLITKGQFSKKLAKNFGMNEDDFVKRFSGFHEIQEIKNALISMMKYSYYMVLTFIKKKVRDFLKNYFEGLTVGKLKLNLSKKKENNLNHSFSNSGTNVKYINFLDFPGEVADQTLGGFSTNLANECLNVFAGSNYFSVVEKLEEEKLNMKYFQPLHSYHVIQSILGKNGIFSYFSRPYTEENFRNLTSASKRNPCYLKTVEFNDHITSTQNEFVFNFKFSHKSVSYNYESLYLEAKSLILSPMLVKLFEASKNSVIKSTYATVFEGNSNILSFTIHSLKQLFQPLERLSPFVIYCLHSNNSRRIFFGEDMTERDPNWVIPRDLTTGMLKNSLTIPVLYWEWFGYHEWVEVKPFVQEFSGDFEKVKEKVLKLKKNTKLKDIPFAELNPYEIATYILSILGREKEYIFGAQHILLKRGSLARLRRTLDNMGEMMKSVQSSREGLKRSSMSGVTNRSNSILQKKDSKRGSKQLLPNRSASISKEPNSNSNQSCSNNKKPTTPNTADVIFLHPAIAINAPPERKFSMKTQCHLNLVDDLTICKTNPLKKGKQLCNPSNKFNIFNLLNEDIIDNSSEENFIDNNNTASSNAIIQNCTESDFRKYQKDNNIIVPQKQYFNIFKNLLDYSNIESFAIFDYQDCLPEIIKIQNALRAFKSRKKYKIYRYVIKKTIMLQKIIRGSITRKKFERFLICLRKIFFIQKFYKFRHNKRARNTIKIQTAWRGLKGYRKGLKKRQLGELYESDSEDEKKTKTNLGEFEKELLNVSVSKADKRKETVTSKKGLSHTLLTLSELENENDKAKIVQTLLLDQSLMKEHDSVNRTFLNAPGISGQLKQTLTQVIKKPPRVFPQGKKVEDKLIEYGETLKQKRAKEKIEKLKKEEMAFSFKPMINKSKAGNDIAQLGDFLARNEQYKQRQEKKLETIRKNIVDPDINQYTFKPEVSKLAKGMKRNLKDLYDWKNKRDKEIQRKKQIKEEAENENIEKSKTGGKMNEYSKVILKQKLEKTMIEQMNQPDLAFDLWPIQMEKHYCQIKNP